MSMKVNVKALLGTPHEPDFRGALLFLEDVAEPAYRIDRMLTQWIQSGRLARIAGIVDEAALAGEHEGENIGERPRHEASSSLTPRSPVACRHSPKRMHHHTMPMQVSTSEAIGVSTCAHCDAVEIMCVASL